MRLGLHPPDHWGFDLLSQPQLEMLNGLKDAADPSEHPEAAKRLHQNPLSDQHQPGEDSEIDELALDWEEYVAPEIQAQFQGDIDLVLSDLKAIEPLTPQQLQIRLGGLDVPEEELKDLELPNFYQLRVPTQHAEPWYSALNQARLVLTEKAQLFDAEGKETIREDWSDAEEAPILSVDASIKADWPTELRVQAYIHTRFFGGIQQWIIEKIMDPTISGEGSDESPE